MNNITTIRIPLKEEGSKGRKVRRVALRRSGGPLYEPEASFHKFNKF